MELTHESAVECDTGELLRLVGLSSLNHSIELGRAGRGRRKCSSHCERVEMMQKTKSRKSSLAGGKTRREEATTTRTKSLGLGMDWI